jgi:hypothetical protein
MVLGMADFSGLWVRFDKEDTAERPPPAVLRRGVFIRSSGYIVGYSPADVNRDRSWLGLRH